MRPSNPLDAEHWRRIRTVIAAKLRKTGRAAQFEEAYEATKDGAVATLPEAHLFSGEGPDRPVSWMLPRLRCGRDGLVYAYEEFVEQPLGVTRNPGKVAEAALRREGCLNLRGRFHTGINPRAWAKPATRLIALAATLDDAAVDIDMANFTYTAVVGQVTFSVTAEGCWSNFNNRVMPAALPPTDIKEATFLLPTVESDERTVVTLMRLLTGEGDHQQAVRGLQECIDQGVVTKLEVRNFFREAFLGGFRERRHPTSRRTKTAALQACLEALATPGENLVRRLHSAAVPTLISARDFRMYFGSPYGNPGRKIRESTLERWEMHLSALADSD